MLESRLFRGWLGWLGVAGGLLLVVGGFLGAAALGDDGDFKDLGEQPSAFGGLLFWVWLLATSIVLWRSRPKAAIAAT
jgi:hypothetical protein